MITSNQQTGKKKQSGLVLLVLVIAIALSISIYYFSTISVVSIKVDNIEKTQKTLKKAKQALLAYAMNYRDTAAGSDNSSQGPGNFPCPDDTLDGISDITSGVVTPGCGSFGSGTLGRFPWATIKAEEYRDASGELLWYAVSSNFANQADKNINTATTGEITVRNANGSIRNNGTTIDGIVAVIIAPGKTLKRDDGLVQSRSTVAEKDNPKNYLDIAYSEDNASFINSDTDGFIMGEVWDNDNNVIVNDLMAVITYSEIMDLVHAKVGDVISVLINDYFTTCGAYPEASAFDPTKALFESAGSAPPAGSELRKGHLPLDSALPINWGGGCTPFIGSPGTTPVPAAWLAAEEWHKVTYYEFAYTNPEFPSPTLAPLSAGTVCTPSVDCLDVNGVTDINALIMFSGRDLTGSRPSALMSDYFEVENNNLDSVYDADEAEDYIRIIAP